MSAEAQPAGSPLRRRALVLVPVIAFAALAALLYVRLYSGDPAALPSALIGRAAPVAALPPVEGLSADGAAMPGFSGADLAAGEVALVNVFASWCGPCRQEHPVLMDLKAKACGSWA